MLIHWVTNNNQFIEIISQSYISTQILILILSLVTPNDDANTKYHFDCYLRFKLEIISKNGKNCLFKSSKGQ